MRKFVIMILISLALVVIAIPAYAQSPTPTETPASLPTGEVTGTIINKSPGGSYPENATVMLHVLDQNYSQLGMLHTPAQADGTFSFEGVPLDQGLSYVGFITYQGASYSSVPVPYDGISTPKIELPIYEATKDLSQVQVDKMHVLFNFAEDGIEVNEIYLISNMGDRTVTGTVTLEDGKVATYQFPLPAGAEYVFFNPDEDSERFIKLENGFVDTAPLVPGEFSNNMMVSYVLPYSDQMSYNYTAPFTVKNIDFLVPAEEKSISLKGENLNGPELTTIPNQSMYQIYTSSELAAGETASFKIIGQPNIKNSVTTGSDAAKAITSPNKWIIVIGSGLFGVLMIAFGIWQWRKSQNNQGDEERNQDEDTEPDEPDAITRIAILDEAYERGEINETEYNAQRAGFVEAAREMLKKQDSYHDT